MTISCSNHASLFIKYFLSTQIDKTFKVYDNTFMVLVLLTFSVLLAFSIIAVAELK